MDAVSIWKKLAQHSVDVYQKNVHRTPPTHSGTSRPEMQGALIDSATRILLVVSTNLPALNVLANSMLDTFLIIHVAHPNYPNGLDLRKSNGSYAGWTWSGKKRIFSESRPDVATESLHQRSRLAIAKVAALSRIMRSLNLMHTKLTTGIEMQNVVYALKKEQALAFKQQGYVGEIVQFPFIVQYADVAHLTLKEAADDILLKAQLDEEVLAKGELLRLTYLQRVREATHPNELPAILEEFARESYINALI